MDRHPKALTIVAVALVLGTAADLLLRYVPWGVNALVWTLLFVLGAALCHRLSWFPALGALVAAAGLLWRDSGTLIALDVLLLLGFLPMLALAARGVRLHDSGLARIAGAVALTGAQSLVGVPHLLLEDLSWKRVPSPGMRGAGVALRGTLIAAPALLVFGLLLSSADEEFSRLLRNVFVFDVNSAAVHLFCIVLFSAMCTGFLRSLTFGREMIEVARPSILGLPAAETNFALGLVNLLFAAFVAVQFRYFFGASPAVLSTYARRGFFELVVVIALVMPMLLALEWLIDKTNGVRTFRMLAVLQIALVFVIAASAWRRMQLYRDAFGLTEDRFYATAFMIWVAVLLVLFLVTVLVGHRERFAFGAFATGLAAVVVLHAINPDALIVRTNLARALEGKRAFDQQYVVLLSDDAAEEILGNPKIPRLAVWQFAHKRRTIGWRTWNVSRARAIALVNQRYESNATPPMRP